MYVVALTPLATLEQFLEAPLKETGHEQVALREVLAEQVGALT
jgi:hypothetical protein